MALVTGDPRSATVVALSPTRLLRLAKERFQALSERHPVFLRELTRVLCRRIARPSEDVAHARRAYTTVPYYLTLYYGTEERAFGHRDARPFAWVYAGAVLAGFLLSLPYWRALGLVGG